MINFTMKPKITTTITSLAVIATLLILANFFNKEFFTDIGESSDYSPPPITNSDTTAVTEEQYNFLFYSLLYAEHPEIRNIPPSDIPQSIEDTISHDDISIYDEISKSTTQLLSNILIYEKDREYKEAKIQIDQKVSDYFDQKRTEASSSGLSFDDYLKVYYHTSNTVEIRNIAERYLSYLEYKNNYLPVYFETNILEDYYTEQYEAAPRNYKLYNISFLSYVYPSTMTESDRDKIKQEFISIYDKTHSHKDFESFSSEFEKSHPYNNSTPSPSGTNRVIGKVMTIDEISLICTSLVDFISSPDLAVDTAALFNTDNGFIMIYYKGSTLNETKTYNGTISDNHGTVCFRNKSLAELGITLDDDQVPISTSVGKQDIFITEEGLPYWKKDILSQYIAEQYSQIENLYLGYAQHILHSINAKNEP